MFGSPFLPFSFEKEPSRVFVVGADLLVLSRFGVFGVVPLVHEINGDHLIKLIHDQRLSCLFMVVLRVLRVISPLFLLDGPHGFNGFDGCNGLFGLDGLFA